MQVPDGSLRMPLLGAWEFAPETLRLGMPPAALQQLHGPIAGQQV